MHHGTNLNIVQRCYTKTYQNANVKRVHTRYPKQQSHFSTVTHQTLKTEVWKSSRSPTQTQMTRKPWICDAFEPCKQNLRPFRVIDLHVFCWSEWEKLVSIGKRIHHEKITYTYLYTVASCIIYSGIYTLYHVHPTRNPIMPHRDAS